MKLSGRRVTGNLRWFGKAVPAELLPLWRRLFWHRAVWCTEWYGRGLRQSTGVPKRWPKWKPCVAQNIFRLRLALCWMRRLYRMQPRAPRCCLRGYPARFPVCAACLPSAKSLPIRSGLWISFVQGSSVRCCGSARGNATNSSMARWFHTISGINARAGRIIHCQCSCKWYNQTSPMAAHAHGALPGNAGSQRPLL